MSKSRKVKYDNKVKAEILKRERPAGFENAYRLDMRTFSKEIYHRKISAQYIEDKVDENIWALTATRLNADVTVGRGFSEDTDKNIVDNISSSELVQAQTNMEVHYEMFLGIKIRQGKALPFIQSIPSVTATLGRSGKYTDKVVINYGTKEEQIVDKFDPLEYQLGRVKDGDYIYHIKQGYGRYGSTPKAAYKRLEIQAGYEGTVNNWYKNDAIPDMIISMFGTDADSPQADAIRKMFNKNYQGSKNRGKAAMLFINGKANESAPKVDILTKPIVDRNSLEMDDRIKFDIATYYGVPYWLMNLVIATAIGNTSERKTEVMCYLYFRITPKREFWFNNVWSILFPEYKIEMAEIDTAQFIAEVPSKAPAVISDEQVKSVAKEITQEFNTEFDTLIDNKTI